MAEPANYHLCIRYTNDKIHTLTIYYEIIITEQTVTIVTNTLNSLTVEKEHFYTKVIDNNREAFYDNMDYIKELKLSTNVFNFSELKYQEMLKTTCEFIHMLYKTDILTEALEIQSDNAMTYDNGTTVVTKLSIMCLSKKIVFKFGNFSKFKKNTINGDSIIPSPSDELFTYRFGLELPKGNKLEISTQQQNVVFFYRTSKATCTYTNGMFVHTLHY